MPRGMVANARAEINAPVEEVWEALTKPERIKQYMFGTEVISGWKEGGSIVWKGVWKGRAYEDKGTILEFKPLRRISYTHFSPLTGSADMPENYHTVSVELLSRGTSTVVRLSQDNNPTAEARNHSQENWEMMLAGLKSLLEANRRD